jgi:hypothetical protein
MKSDKHFAWLVDARNQIEKRGDLDTHSRARLQIVSGWKRSPEIEMAVDPTEESFEIARRVAIDGLPRRVREDGVLTVERRWTVKELAGEEMLDVLAHCHGWLLCMVASAHDLLGESFASCEETEASCDYVPGAFEHQHPSGRLPCMLAGREARTFRRSLATLAPLVVEMVGRSPRQIDEEEIRRRYGTDAPVLPSKPEGLFGQAAAFHDWGRHVLQVDGHHIPMAWLWRDSSLIRHLALDPVDEQAKYLIAERLGSEVESLGADAVILSGEVWETPVEALGADEPPADRPEAFVTVLVERGGPWHTWRSRIRRAPDDAIVLDPVEEPEHFPAPPFLVPVLRVWERWPL